MVEWKDFIIALCGWYCELDSEWCGKGTAFDYEYLKRIMEKYDITKDEILENIPREWT